MSHEQWALHPGVRVSDACGAYPSPDRLKPHARVDDGQVLDAYKAYLDHLEQAACGICPELLEGRCDTGQALWDTYKETMRP